MADTLNFLHAEEVLNLLDQACAQRVALHLRLPDDPHVYDTSIDDLDHSRRLLRIFTIEEGDTDRRMEPGTQVGILLRVDGLPYRFTAKVAPTSQGMHYHLLSFPDKIEVVQRRSNVRVVPPWPDSVEIKAAWGESDTLLLVEALDVSLGGVLLRLPTDSGDVEKDMPVQVEMRFPDETHMLLDGKFCRILPEKKHSGGITVGVRFIDMRPSREIDLGRILMEWQRQNRRKEIVDKD